PLHPRAEPLLVGPDELGEDAPLALVAQRAEEVVERGEGLVLLVHVDDGLTQRAVEVREVIVAVILELLDAAQPGHPDLEHEVDEVRKRNLLHENGLLTRPISGRGEIHGVAPAGGTAPRGRPEPRSDPRPDRPVTAATSSWI